MNTSTRAELGDAEHALFNLILTNVSKAHKILNWVNEQPRVRYARMDLVDDRIEMLQKMNRSTKCCRRRWHNNKKKDVRSRT